MSADDEWWPFGDEADQDDPLTLLRVAVASPWAGWSFIVSFDPESPDRPTDAEAAMLASFLDQYKHYWYGNNGFARKLLTRALDVDGGANGIAFRKYGPDDWAYRRRSWNTGPMFVPQPPYIRADYPAGDQRPGPLGLAALMEHIHALGGEPNKTWSEWTAAHPEVFAGVRP